MPLLMLVAVVTSSVMVRALIDPLAKRGDTETSPAVVTAVSVTTLSLRGVRAFMGLPLPVGERGWSN